MPLAPGTGMGIKPPPPIKPPPVTQAQALAEHIAQQSGHPLNLPAPPETIDASGPSSPASLASYAGRTPDYSQAATLIQQFLAAEGSPLARTPFARAVTKRSRKWGVDPRLVVAIAGAETSLGKDPAAAPASDHNVWGMGPGIQYDSWKQGANAVAKNLATNYFSEGLDTIPEISGKWAPPGASNDPNDVNANWTGNVRSYFNRLSKVVGKEAAMKLFPVLGNADWTSAGGVAAHMSRPLGNWQSDNAIDMATKVGTPVYAPAGGRLVGGFGPSDNGATVYGNRLTLDPRAPGLPDWFMTHMSHFAPGLEEGDRVHRGEVLGYVGQRDSSWLPHLHFGQEFGNPETTVEKNMYDPVSAVPGQAGQQYSGVGSSWSRPSTQQDVAKDDAAAAQLAATQGMLQNAAFGEAPGFAKKGKRRPASSSLIEEIIARLTGGV